MPNEQTASNDSQGSEHHGRSVWRWPAVTGHAQPARRSGRHQGAVVEEVQPGSPAEAAGLQPGDVIVGVGTHAVTSPAEAARAMRAAMNGSDHALALRVIRNGQPVFVGVNSDQNSQGYPPPPTLGPPPRQNAGVAGFFLKVTIALRPMRRR